MAVASRGVPAHASGGAAFIALVIGATAGTACRGDGVHTRVRPSARRASGPTENEDPSGGERVLPSPADAEGVVLDTDVPVAEPGLGSGAERVEPWLEQEPGTEVSGHTGAVHPHGVRN